MGFSSVERTPVLILALKHKKYGKSHLKKGDGLAYILSPCTSQQQQLMAPKKKIGTWKKDCWSMGGCVNWEIKCKF